MSEFEYNKLKEPSSLDRLRKFEKNGLDETDPRSVAEYTLLVNYSIAEGISDGSIDIHEDNYAVELSLRNFAVLINRIKSNDIAVDGVSQKQMDKVRIVDRRSGALVESCVGNLLVEELDGVRSLQAAIYDGNRIPDEAADMVALLLKKSTDTFVEIVSDPKVTIDESLILYFAGNTTGAAGWASDKLKLG